MHELWCAVGFVVLREFSVCARGEVRMHGGIVTNVCGKRAPHHARSIGFQTHRCRVGLPS